MSPWFGKGNPESGAPKWPAPAARGGRLGEKVKVSPLLTERTIIIAAQDLGKDALLDALISRLAEEKKLSDPSGLLAKVLEREQGISTTLDSGLSLPHARVDNLAQIVAAMGVAGHGIRDPKQKDLAIRVMFLFFSPNKSESFPLHLQLLRGVSALLQPSVIDSLAKAPSPAAVLEILRAQES